MGLKNLFGWNSKAQSAPASACGAGDPAPSKPKPTVCGIGDKK